VVAVNGDLVSGDIHDELRRTNALTAHEQAYLAADELAAGLRLLADKFGAVMCCVTPGNHGRTTEKTHAKRVGALSYDMLVGEMVRRASQGRRPGDGPARDGSGNGLSDFAMDRASVARRQPRQRRRKGFAGPVLPIIRGTKNVEWQAYLVRRAYDIIPTAH